METTDPKVIKNYANRYGYSDVEPHEVVHVIASNKVVIRRMSCTLRNIATATPGGFAGHTDNQTQCWEVKPDPYGCRYTCRWNEAKKQWITDNGFVVKMADKPVKFYDFNF